MLAFAHFGGVPTGLVRYDNLKAAVTRVLVGRDRVENERFVALRSHYGFESFFCAPGIAGAHEKGGVEGQVGRFRRRHLVPVPEFASLDALNAHIAAALLIALAAVELRFDRWERTHALGWFSCLRRIGAQALSRILTARQGDAR